MLVLSRKEGERLLIGDDIVLTITKLNGNRVSVGIEAPRDVRIVRGELELVDVAGGEASTCGVDTNQMHVAIASKANA